MMVNEVKTKYMIFSSNEVEDLYFVNIAKDLVTSRKYVGNKLIPSCSPYGNFFNRNYDNLFTQARKYLFSMNLKLKNAAPTPPNISVHLFEPLIKSILSHGSDILGNTLYKSRKC